MASSSGTIITLLLHIDRDNDLGINHEHASSEVCEARERRRRRKMLHNLIARISCYLDGGKKEKKLCENDRKTNSDNSMPVV
jgi:hypothetical protein